MSTPSPNNEFLDLFTGSQLRLYRYIVALVGSQVDAEDILQNVNLILLRKCDQFEPGTNFLSWSTGIAHFEVLKYRTARKRTVHELSESTLAVLAAEALRHTTTLDQRNAALPGCLEKLPSSDRELVNSHYFHGLSWETIAERIGRTSSSVRHSICRIRHELKRCIDAAVGKEEQA